MKAVILAGGAGEPGLCKHSGFWQCMDTQRGRNRLEKLWGCRRVPWKRWENNK